MEHLYLLLQPFWGLRTCLVRIDDKRLDFSSFLFFFWYSIDIPYFQMYYSITFAWIQADIDMFLAKRGIIKTWVKLLREAAAMAEIIMSRWLVHSTESFGIRRWSWYVSIVFMQGYKMRCHYCHNPDTWAMESNKAVERTVEDVLDEASSFPSFLGAKAWWHHCIRWWGHASDWFLSLPLFTEARLDYHTLDTCGFAYRNTLSIMKLLTNLAVTDLVHIKRDWSWSTQV